MYKRQADLQRLVEVLRAPGGCPWDGAQTHLSIRRNFLEEAYEACEGFDLDDPAHMLSLIHILVMTMVRGQILYNAGKFPTLDLAGALKELHDYAIPKVFSDDSEEAAQ